MKNKGITVAQSILTGLEQAAAYARGEDVPVRHTYRSRPIKKKAIHIMLDEDVILFFKNQAKKAGAAPYQTQINSILREAIEKQVSGNNDINALAELIAQKVAKDLRETSSTKETSIKKKSAPTKSKTRRPSISA